MNMFNQPEDDSIFNEYSVDDTLDSLSRLKKYQSSDFHLQRKVLVREMYDICVEVGYKKAVEDILPLIKNFILDNEAVVRQTLAEELYPLAIFFYENAFDKKTAYKRLINIFIPYTFELIIDKKIDVSDAATKSLVKIAKMIKGSHVESQLFEVIKNISKEMKIEVYRIAAAKLFNLLAPVFGEKLCIEKVTDAIVDLSEDPSLSVRKTVAQNLGKISSIVGETITVNKLFPIYNKLSHDEIWGVRKACAEALPIMSENVTKTIRMQILPKLFDNFTADVSRWVKIEAYKKLGAFIATYRNDGDIPHSLITYFVDMSYQGDQSETEMVEFCAFNFPAVCLTVGKPGWNRLQRCFKALVKDVQWKVRKSLASSLHEIAQIVGTQITETVLCAAFHAFIKDLDDVKIGVISNITKFLSVVSKNKRMDFLEIIIQIPDETENWRIKNEIAKQISELLELFSNKKSRNKIKKLFFALLEDDFAIIKKTTAASSGKFLSNLIQNQDQDIFNDFMAFSKKLASSTWANRQLFIDICHHVILAIPRKEFEQNFLPFALTLEHDPITLVKISLAKLINNDILQNENWKDDKRVLRVKETLQNDKDKDVIYFINKTELSYRTALQTIKLHQLNLKKSSSFGGN